MKNHQARTVAELAEVVRGRVHGDPQTVIQGIASIEEAQTGDITFAESERFLENARQSSASAILAAPTTAHANNVAKAVIEVENPKLAFAQLLSLFAPEQYLERAVHPSAVLGSGVRLGSNVSIGAGAVLGENVTLGDNVTIYPLAYLGDDCEIGDDTTVYPNATILRGTVIGKRGTIHAGSVLGADGYGFVTVGGKHEKIPQIGHVWLGDDVELGANVTIDRARTGATRIGSGTKIDNQVHIGHNCQIGERCLIVAQVGLAGGVVLGDQVIMAGRSGAKGADQDRRRLRRRGGLGRLPRPRARLVRLGNARPPASRSPQNPGRVEPRPRDAPAHQRPRKAPRRPGEIRRVILLGSLLGSVVVEGVGIHSGEPCRVTVEGVQDEGIVFVRNGVSIPARAEYVTETARCTKLGLAEESVSTVEHLMSALAIMNVRDARIIVEGPELPILDGSASAWVAALDEAGSMPTNMTPPDTGHLLVTRPISEPITGGGAKRELYLGDACRQAFDYTDDRVRPPSDRNADGDVRRGRRLRDGDRARPDVRTSF